MDINSYLGKKGEKMIIRIIQNYITIIHILIQENINIIKERILIRVFLQIHIIIIIMY